jgi:hypothetical protein
MANKCLMHTVASERARAHMDAFKEQALMANVSTWSQGKQASVHAGAQLLKLLFIMSNLALSIMCNCERVWCGFVQTRAHPP